MKTTSTLFESIMENRPLTEGRKQTAAMAEQLANDIVRHMLEEGFSLPEVVETINTWDWGRITDKVARHGHTEVFDSDYEAQNFCEQNATMMTRELLNAVDNASNFEDYDGVELVNGKLVLGEYIGSDADDDNDIWG